MRWFFSLVALPPLCNLLPMKNNILKWSKTAITLALAQFLGAFVVTAADTPAQPAPPSQLRVLGDNPPDRGPGPGGPGLNGRGPRMAGGGMMVLDDQQRETYREATQKNSEELRNLDQKFRAAQKEFVHAAMAEKYDEKVVREKADAVAKIQTDMSMLRAKAFSTVAPTLKPEQREQLENSRVGAAMLTSGFGGMGGGIGGPAGKPGNNPPTGPHRPATP